MIVFKIVLVSVRSECSVIRIGIIEGVASTEEADCRVNDCSGAEEEASRLIEADARSEAGTVMTFDIVLSELTTLD